MNNKIIIGIVVVVVIVGAVAFYMNNKSSYQMNMQQQTPPAQTQTNPTSSTQTATAKNAVTIQNYSFSPATLTVKVGDQVTWTNQDSVGHSATADDNSFDTGVLSQGQAKALTFSKAGTYTYHCSVHPNMKATIVVQ